MSLAALIAFLNANQATIATILLVISEALGATPKVRSNGILSFLLLRSKDYLRSKGGRNVE